MTECCICGKVPSDVEYNYISVRSGLQYVVCTADLEMLLDAALKVGDETDNG